MQGCYGVILRSPLVVLDNVKVNLEVLPLGDG